MANFRKLSPKLLLGESFLFADEGHRVSNDPLIMGSGRSENHVFARDEAPQVGLNRSSRCRR